LADWAGLWWIWTVVWIWNCVAEFRDNLMKLNL
jgi:hypothetical protein